MAQTKSLHEVFVDEMRDVYNGEQQITKALPKMIKAAESDELRRALENHLDETKTQIQRLERAFSLLDEKARGKKCDGIEGILEEGKKIMQEDIEGAVMDAAIIAGAQRVEHYEMGAYGTLVAWAEAMGHNDVARLLKETLEEEKNADKILSELAESGINQLALQEHGEEDMGNTSARGDGRANGRNRADSRSTGRSGSMPGRGNGRTTAAQSRAGSRAGRSR
jgi:ferritin-like metal-binding protein YciE